jgi:hypothetical protein
MPSQSYAAAKRDQYGMRIKEFNIFLFVRFYLFWLVYTICCTIEWEFITKDKFIFKSIIGLMEVFKKLSVALFAGHICGQKKKKTC